MTKITVRPFVSADVDAMRDIWNEVVRDGEAFPQEDGLTAAEAEPFFAAQTRTAAAVDGAGNVLGMYILHPNNIGRCGHLCNASFAVARAARGQHVGEALVRDCLTAAKTLGFRVLQFNAVVAENTAARRLYEHLGFVPLGTVPGGFRRKDGSFADICLYYHTL